MSVGTSLLVWLLCTGVLIWSQWRDRVPRVGLTIAYMMNFALNHFFGAAVNLLPWFEGPDLQFVELGFPLSTLAFAMFTLASVLLWPVASRYLRGWWASFPARVPDPRLPKTYIITGLLFYGFVSPALVRIPSVRAFAGAGWSLMIVGLCLATWKAWNSRSRHIIRWLVAALLFPVFTVVKQGFMSFGTAAVIVVFSFVATFYRPRWKVAVASVLCIYLGLSLYVTYIRDREDIRDVVWSGESTTSKQFESVWKTVTAFELFDINSADHLHRVDARLNQNILVGISMDYIAQGNIAFAKGETLWYALIAMVPRILWPDKPVQAGSMGIVGLYTGIEFNEETSVGLGQVLEFYINYGTASVVIGFLVLGLVINFFDETAGRALYRGDWQRCILWYMPGLGLLQAGGSLVEVTSTTLSSFLFCWFVNRFVLSKYAGRIQRFFRRPRAGALRAP